MRRHRIPKRAVVEGDFGLGVEVFGVVGVFAATDQQKRRPVTGNDGVGSEGGEHLGGWVIGDGVASCVGKISEVQGPGAGYCLSDASSRTKAVLIHSTSLD